MRKNSKNLKRVLLITISMLCLTACQSKGASGVDEEKVETGDVKVGDVKTEDVETEDVETGDIDAGDIDAGDMEAPSDAKLKEILDSTINWAALLYTSEPVAVEGLTMQEALPMVGEAIALSEQNSATDIPYDEMNGIYTISREIMNRWSKDYFGKTFESAGLDDTGKYGNYLTHEGTDGGIEVNVGDWGLSAPVYDIIEVKDMGNHQWTVSVDYTMFDYDTSKKRDTMYHIDYVLESNKDSKFGFIITDLKGK